MNAQNKRDKRQGFSLVELMVVVALIGILTAVGFVSMLHYRTLIRVNTSARDLAGHMRFARATAIRNNNSVAVRFFESTGRYLIGIDGNEDGVPDGISKTYFLEPGIRFGIFPTIDGLPGHPSKAPCAINISRTGPDDCTTNYTNFRHDGTTNFSGAVYLIPTNDLSSTGNRDDRMRGVDWETQSGRVRVWKWKYADRVWR